MPVVYIFLAVPLASVLSYIKILVSLHNIDIMPSSDILHNPPKALTFDVFGTVGMWTQSLSFWHFEVLDGNCILGSRAFESIVFEAFEKNVSQVMQRYEQALTNLLGFS